MSITNGVVGLANDLGFAMSRIRGLDKLEQLNMVNLGLGIQPFLCFRGRTFEH